MSTPPLHIDDTVSVHSGGGEGPLLLLLHGYGSHERDLAGLVPFLPDGLATVALRAPLTLQEGAYAWVPIDVPGRPDPAVTTASTEALLTWLDGNVPPARPVALLGFSQGGLMVTQLLRARPDRFVAGLVLSGFVLDQPLPGDASLAARRPPVFFGHGDADPVIAPDATARAATWLPQHCETTDRLYPGLAHGISGEELADVSEFLRTYVI